MGYMSSSGHQTPTEAPIVEESLKSGDEIPQEMRDFTVEYAVQFLVSPAGPVTLKVEGTLESLPEGGFDTLKLEEALENPTVDDEEYRHRMYMKGGACKDVFVALEKCLDDAGGSIETLAQKEFCIDAGFALGKCMQAHPDYYEPAFRKPKPSVTTD